jgi:membrane protein
LRAAQARFADMADRAQQWADRQAPGSLSGVVVGAWRRYDAVDGPRQSALLALYILVAVVPAVLVIAEYLETDPSALASHMARHYALSAPTTDLIRGVLEQDRTHELGSALLAIAAALFFGLGFGRVLQHVHVRAWGLELRSRQADQPRYALVLLGLFGLILVLLVQLAELAGGPTWVRFAVTPGWVALVALYFGWSARLLTHKLVSWRNVLPGAALTAAGIVLLMWVSRYVMEFWVNLYARDYGGFGVVMAIFFWIAFSSAVIVAAAALGPALAERRAARRGSTDTLS